MSWSFVLAGFQTALAIILSNLFLSSMLKILVKNCSKNLVLIVKLFIKLSSHANTDIVVATHSGIKSSSGKHFSIVWNSANTIVLFRTLADRASIGFLSQRMFPYSDNHLGKCLAQATQLLGNYSHIIIFCNLDNDLNRTYEVRANIFEDAYILFKNPTYYAAG